jgi:hypothetical protein
MGGVRPNFEVLGPTCQQITRITRPTLTVCFRITTVTSGRPRKPRVGCCHISKGVLGLHPAVTGVGILQCSITPTGHQVTRRIRHDMTEEDHWGPRGPPSRSHLAALLRPGRGLSAVLRKAADASAHRVRISTPCMALTRSNAALVEQSCFSRAMPCLRHGTMKCEPQPACPTLVRQKCRPVSRSWLGHHRHTTMRVKDHRSLTYSY